MDFFIKCDQIRKTSMFCAVKRMLAEKSISISSLHTQTHAKFNNIDILQLPLLPTFKSM